MLAPLVHVLAVVALAWILGCSGEETFLLPSVDAGIPVTPYAAACAAWAQAECAFEASCYPSIVTGWLDPAQCEQRRSISCELEAADPDVAFDPALVAGCTFTDCVATLGLPPNLCLPPGKAPEGAPCVWDDACASRYCAYGRDAYGQSSCGLCEILPPPCTCGPDAMCAYKGDEEVSCVVPPSVGDPCGPPMNSCAGSAQCVVPDGGSTGTCMDVPTATEGQPCGTGSLGPNCVGLDAYCDPVALTCGVEQAGAYGDPCPSSNGGAPVVCVGGGVCDYSVSGTCLPPSPDAEPCDETQGLYCLFPARCLDHACVFPTTATCAL